MIRRRLEWIRGSVGRLGPTWLAGAIAAGPATMATLLTAGAGYGYTLLWVVVLSAVLGAMGQYLAARLGLLSGEGIVQTVERHLGKPWAWLLVLDVVVAAGLAQLVIMRTVADVSAAIAVNAGIATLGDPRVWGIIWAVILALGLAGGGYRVAEFAAKVLVSGVVIAFVVSLFVVPIDARAAVSGLTPQIPPEIGAAMVAAAILGGAVHITLLTMQSYTMRARGWGRGELPLVRFDITTSMLLAFGGYSLAIFLVAASVLAGVSDLSPLQAAEALGPLVGEHATWLFLIGLWGAAVTTLGGNTVVPPYLLADKLGWETHIGDRRYRALLAGVALVSGAGAFIEGALFPLLVLVLAFGLIGTPFALVLILILLHDPEAVSEPTTRRATAGGVVVLVVATVLAGSTVLEQVRVADGPLSFIVIAFAVVMVVAIVILLLNVSNQRFR